MKRPVTLKRQASRPKLTTRSKVRVRRPVENKTGTTRPIGCAR